jgi:Domain of unknown function (DUF4864)
MRRILIVLAAMFLSVSLSNAQSLSETDRQAFQGIITGQIEAFRADDGARAYSFAAPMIKQIFPNPDVFMNMVREGYPQVYRPQSFNFGPAELSASGRPTQRVTIVGPDGMVYEAIYTMEQQPDGTWQINGCAIVRAPDMNA